ncbi:hypothetical protein [Mastigocoleus testarum]|uniref:Ig-like domain-containing protein n=1 Tax=Mastigocoleus testarum BC008 TaxID=371196 RepID=A0A0V7ZRI5_9CYAN|nr:hypothetical protein [Mastigocoleus testarum]KST67284.1 hypothetical protein BC008_29290 [Mastigocoleus testarum BC008]
MTLTKPRIIVRLFFALFLCIFIASCESETSSNTSERQKNSNVEIKNGREKSREVEINNSFVKVTGEDENGSYKCSGVDPEITRSGVQDTSIYSCDGDKLIINR